MALPRERFSAPAIALHWMIAGLLLANLYLGLSYGSATGLAKFNLIQLHKSLGFTVLALSLARLGLRLFGPRPPPLPQGMKPWERLAAHAVHWGFYGVMLGLPLTGWVMVSASPTNIPTLLFKTLPAPFIGPVHAQPMPVRRVIEDGFEALHSWMAWLTIAMLVLHVGAALKHQFWSRDGLLLRMLPLPARRG